MGLLSKLFGRASKQERIIEMINNGGIIIDVRTAQEFNQGHVNGSQNIPLNHFKDRLKDIKRLNKPIILCCASGMRSGQATAILKKEGIDAINGGSWRSLAN